MLERIDPTVKRMTCYIAACALVLSALMEAVYLVIGAWNMTVLWGNLLGAAVAVLNFFLMGLTIQRSLGLSEEDAKKFIRVSQSLRMLMILVVCAIGAAIPAVFDLLAVVLPQFFPRIGTMLWPKFEKNKQTNE
ncbi:MAG: ATP synthase subunit I [Christensenellaceae bacterium]|nr:ATP synthase subunit I [Christensenellaceae bacterium]